MNAPVVAHLDDEYLVSMHIHTSINMTGTKVVGVRHAMCLNPTDRAWIAD